MKCYRNHVISVWQDLLPLNLGDYFYLISKLKILIYLDFQDLSHYSFFGSSLFYCFTEMY